MATKVDLIKLQDLSEQMKRIKSQNENIITQATKEVESMLQEVNNCYPEYYVRTATQEIHQLQLELKRQNALFDEMMGKRASTLYEVV